MATTIQRSALLPFAAERVYRLVNDVAAYPRYMDGCVGAEVLESSDQHMLARLDLAKAGVSYSFTTRNRLEPHECIEMSLEEGPFEQFTGTWRFHALAAQACKVELDLRFSLAGSVRAAAMGKVINLVGNNLVDALSKRAGEIYG